MTSRWSCGNEVLQLYPVFFLKNDPLDVSSLNRGSRVMRATSFRMDEHPQAVPKVCEFVLRLDVKSSKSFCCLISETSLPQDISFFAPPWFSFFENPRKANIWHHISKSWFYWVLDSNLGSHSSSTFSTPILRSRLSTRPLPQGGRRTDICGSHLHPYPRAMERCLIGALSAHSQKWSFTMGHWAYDSFAGMTCRLEDLGLG